MELKSYNTGNPLLNVILGFGLLIFVGVFIYKGYRDTDLSDQSGGRIEELKKFTKGDISKIIILTEGHYLKFQAVCTFVIHDKLLIKEFQTIISKQNTVIKKKAWGQTGRETHITLYNSKNETYKSDRN